MAFVLDASVAACWAFADAEHPVATYTLEQMRTEQAWVPRLGEREAFPLATLDKQLKAAAATVKVALFGADS